MRKNKRSEIIAAAISLVAKKGVSGSSVRQIAEEAGVTEGAVYRHFDSKKDLCHQAYCQIVADMVSEKDRILDQVLPIHVKFREWVRVSFEYFDRYPDAFTYVLLTNHDFPEKDTKITTRQGEMLMQMFETAFRSGELAPVDPEIALSHFTGVMLNVPRLINHDMLQSPASQYTTEVVSAIYRIFEMN